jgi:hypothetical protein
MTEKKSPPPPPPQPPSPSMSFSSPFYFFYFFLHLLSFPLVQEAMFSLFFQQTDKLMNFFSKTYFTKSVINVKIAFLYIMKHVKISSQKVKTLIFNYRRLLFAAPFILNIFVHSFCPPPPPVFSPLILYYKFPIILLFS